MIIRIILVLICLFTSLEIVSAAIPPAKDVNLRITTIGHSGADNTVLNSFIVPIQSFFFSAWDDYGQDGIIGAFTTIAFQIKNFFIAIAVIFLIIGVIKLLFSSSDEENVKKWKANIIWTSVGIFVMQIAFSVWKTLILKSDTDSFGSGLGWDFWINIFSPVVNLLQMLAAFAFILMAIFAFFIMVTAGWDEEKVKKSKNTILYAIIGFLLIKIPETFVKAIYGDYKWCDSIYTTSSCINSIKPNISDSIGIVWKIFTFFNTFLSIICVILVIYAGWLILISGGDEEKIKKAKNIILYIIIGFIILVWSHAIFNFFILKG